MIDLCVSIVSFSPSLETLRATIESLARAALVATENQRLHSVRLMLVDNGPGNGWETKIRNMLEKIEGRFPFLKSGVISGHGNIGFGAGHNLAIAQSSSRYHLVLNPDVIIDPEAIKAAMDFMEKHHDVACLSPYADGPDGQQQFLCKRYPSILDLALRGFAPKVLEHFFRKRLSSYEMRDEYMQDRPIFDVPIVSGCFMFFRTKVLKQMRGFSLRYFLYFEDFDLSLRTGKVARLAFVPAVKITHYGGETSRKGGSHIKMFIRSGLIFFQEHGWKFW